MTSPPDASLCDLNAAGVLHEALDSKRSVRERLVRSLRRELACSFDASPLQVPVAGATDSAMAPACEPLGAFLLEVLGAKAGESAAGQASAAGAHA
jgi:hypothetical protein